MSFRSNLDPAQLANVGGMDQAVAEARDNLEDLIAYARKAEADWDDTRLGAEIAQGLMNMGAWNRTSLAGVLGVAVARLAREARHAA